MTRREHIHTNTGHFVDAVLYVLLCVCSTRLPKWKIETYVCYQHDWKTHSHVCMWVGALVLKRRIACYCTQHRCFVLGCLRELTYVHVFVCVWCAQNGGGGNGVRLRCSYHHLLAARTPANNAGRTHIQCSIICYKE